MEARPVCGDDEGGFTLVELMLVILLVGILTAVALPMYIGYTRDARLNEGKRLVSSVLRAIEGCVQGKGPGSACDRPEIAPRVGLDPGGFTSDGRWSLTGASMALGAAPIQLAGSISVAGVAGRDTDAMSLAMFATPGGLVLRCNLSSLAPPASATAGQPC